MPSRACNQALGLQQLFELYTLFQLTRRSSHRQAWVTEHCLIGTRQPKLNNPYITLYLKRSALGFRSNKRIRLNSYSRFGMRLWRQLRKKLYSQLQPAALQLRMKAAWEILFTLTRFSTAPFEEANRDRPERFAPDDIYSLIRLSNSLEEPGRTKAKRGLKSVCKHRNTHGPDPHQDCR